MAPDDGGDFSAGVAIVGLGLIGGSLARDLSTVGARVLGLDSNPDTLRRAMASGILDGVLPPDLAGIEQAEVVVLALPVGQAEPVLQRIAARIGPRTRLVTDTGSTKAQVVRSAERLGLGPRFVGGHPLAGDHRAGWAASRVGLFREARVFLSACTDTTVPALRLARELWEVIGARPEEISAADHDTRLAWTSHLPQLLSTLLARALDEAGIARDDLGPGGNTMTRLAASDPEVWTGITLQNAPALGQALNGVEEQLASLLGAVEGGDEAALRRFLDDGQSWTGRRGVGAPP